MLVSSHFNIRYFHIYQKSIVAPFDVNHKNTLFFVKVSSLIIVSNIEYSGLEKNLLFFDLGRKFVHCRCGFLCGNFPCLASTKHLYNANKDRLLKISNY